MNRRPAWPGDAFWADTLHACAPLAIWVAHFFGSYVLVATGCRAGLDAPSPLGMPLLNLGLIAFTLLALSCLAAIALRATWTRPGHAAHAKGAVAIRFAAAVLGLVAVAWTLPAMLLITSCLQ